MPPPWTPSAAIGSLALLALSVMGALAAEDHWRRDLPVEHPAEVRVDFSETRSLAGRSLVVAGDWSTFERAGWLECGLVNADGRYFATRASIPLRQGGDVLHLPFTPAVWGGHDGPLDADAAAGIVGLVVRVHGGSVRNEPLLLDLGLEPAAAEPAPTLSLIHGGPIDRGVWRELHLRLPGLDAAAIVDLILADDRRIPCFAHRAVEPDLGRVRLVGPQRWIARLRPDEVLDAGWRIEIDGRIGPPGPALTATVAASDPAPPPATGIPVFDRSPERAGPTVVRVAGRNLRRQVDAHPAPAPILHWRADWRGFRGAEIGAHLAAAELDRLLLSPRPPRALDLLPQTLFEERSTYRFGLSPWSQAQGGSWAWPGEAFASSGPLRDLTRHIRCVIARARAAPGLEQWRISCRQTVAEAGEQQRLRELVAAVESMLVGDPRPLIIDHPQLVDFADAKDERALGRWWCDFERGIDGWRGGNGTRARLVTDDPAQGKVCLSASFESTTTGPVVEFVRELDANVFNLDRLEFDARCDGDGELVLFCWVTDDRHRWYQQAVGSIAAGRGWQRVLVDFAPEAAWTTVGHDTPWDGTQRRRIRTLGITAYAHDRSRPDGTVAIDGLVRRGWPVQAEPELRIEDLAVRTPEVSTYGTLAVDFDLSLDCVNPYDPDYADVVGVATAPDGTTRRHPAYFAEALTVETRDRREAVTGSRSEGWHWRFMPDAPGTWRWHLEARLRYRDRWLNVHGAEHTTTVTPAPAETLLPVRRSTDPRYWETVDGAFFYPIGLNLRSPGDDRQDLVLADAGVAIRSEDYQDLGLGAYEDWFADMQANGVNYARVWLSPWWCGLEWTREWDGYGGLTVYNQLQAARFDALCAMARRHGVYLQIEVQNHGMTSANVDAQWHNSPYNQRNGGPCRSAADYFSDEAAWTAHAKRLRYTIARYGHHPHIMAWVLTSEVEWTGSWHRNAKHHGGHDPATARWVERNLEWFAAHDHLDRPVSIHFSHPWRAERLWRHPGLDFNYSNAYTGFQTDMDRLGGKQARLDTALTWYLGHHYPPWELDRPTMIGEWGGHWTERSHTTLAAEIHTGTWMQTVLPYGGNTGFWWWLWIDATDSWDRYRAVSRFMADEDPRGHDLRILQNQARGGTHPCAYVGAQGEAMIRLYVWRRGLEQRLQVTPATHAGRIELAVTPESRWRVERWNCQRGDADHTDILTAGVDGTLVLEIGALDPDAAFKLDRMPPLEAAGDEPAGAGSDPER